MSATLPSLMEIAASLEKERTAEECVRDLIHELRQPLSTIELIAYYIESNLLPDQPEARQHLMHVRQLIEESNAIMTRAAREYAAI